MIKARYEKVIDEIAWAFEGLYRLRQCKNQTVFWTRLLFILAFEDTGCIFLNCGIRLIKDIFFPF